VDMYENSLQKLIFCLTLPSSNLLVVNSQVQTWALQDMEHPSARVLQEQTSCLFQRQPEPVLNPFKSLPFGEPVIDPLDDFFHHSTISSIGNTSMKNSDSDCHLGVVKATHTAFEQASGAAHEAGSVLLLVLFVLLVSLLIVSCVFVVYERSGGGYQDDDAEFLEELAAQKGAGKPLISQQSLPRSVSSTTNIPVVEPHVGQHLCPELVVPPGNECSLLVPHASASRTQSILSINDVNRVPVFRVSFQNDVSGNYQPRRLALSNANGGRVFAYACDGLGGFTLHHQAGAIVGEFRAEESATGVSFAVDMRSGMRMKISRDAKHKLKFKDESGHLLAVAKTSTESSDMPVDLLRIGSLMDAGLVVLAMLCVQLQEVRHH